MLCLLSEIFAIDAHQRWIGYSSHVKCSTSGLAGLSQLHHIKLFWCVTNVMNSFPQYLNKIYHIFVKLHSRTCGIPIVGWKVCHPGSLHGSSDFLQAFSTDITMQAFSTDITMQAFSTDITMQAFSTDITMQASILTRLKCR